MDAVAPLYRIRPPRRWRQLRLREAWAYRELLYFFVWRDVKVRYKQTVLGAAWAVLQPLATMVLFSIVFGRLVGVPSDGVPYPLFAFAGLVMWTFFATALGNAAGSVVSNANLIRKIYFPRVLIPASGVIGGLVDLAIAFGVLGALMLWFGVLPTWKVIVLPVLLLLAVVTALGAGLCLAALNALFRDVQYTVPFLVQFWFFATPVAYPSSLVPEPWRTVMAINPMVGVVEGMRWALLGTTTAPLAAICVSTIVAGALLIVGALCFRQLEGTFADRV
jgi:lipopolysaccharide transport system permease protein